MAGRYKSRAYPSRYGAHYNDRTDAPIDAPMDDNVDLSARTDDASPPMEQAPDSPPPQSPTAQAPKGRGKTNPKRKTKPRKVAQDDMGEDGGTDEGERGREGATGGTSSSAAIQQRGGYLSRRKGESPISERTRAAVLSRVSPIRVLSHIARGLPMLTTWTDPKTGETKEIWVRPTVDQRLRAAEIGMDRVAPRLRAIEVSGETAHSYRLTVDDLRGILAAADPVTREIAEAEYEELTGESAHNSDYGNTGEGGE